MRFAFCVLILFVYVLVVESNTNLRRVEFNFRFLICWIVSQFIVILCINASILLCHVSVTALALHEEVVARRVTETDTIAILFLALFRKLSNLVVVCCKVRIYVPSEVTCRDYVSVDVDFNTSVDHVTNVIVVSCPTERRRQWYPREHVGSTVVIVLDTTPDAVLEEREVETDVELRILLPRDVRVTKRAWVQRNLIVRVVDREVLCILIRTNLVVTILTVRSLELQLVNPVNIEELLLVDEPAATE